MESSAPISVHSDENGLVITPRAELSGAQAEALRALLLQWLERPLPFYRLDLGQLTDLDPLVLAVLISFEQTLRSVAPDSKITIENASPDVRALLEATRMTECFPIAS